jgi:CarD family transcriptional regulator
MYSTGDQIVHPRYGAGTIVGKKKLTFKGKTRNYHIVELVGDRGEVMIPVEVATNMNIRPAIEDLSIIEEVFAAPPSELSDDYRSRQATIQKQIQTREPEAMATALRDLFWREQTDKLTSVELKMKSSLMKMLSHEIAVICADMTVEKASSHLTQMLYRMVQEPNDPRPEEGAEAL